MEHNLFRLPHCHVHHTCCCSGSPFLKNHPGKLSTLFGVRYILATVDFAPTLVPLHSTDIRTRTPAWALEGLVWRDGRLLSEEDFPDGTDVHFDAVLKFTGQGAYQLVLAWLGCKPSQVLVPAKGTCHLLKCHQNVLPDFSLAGKLYVKVKIGDEVHQLSSPKTVLKDGIWIEISSVNEKDLKAMKACICEILVVQNNRFVRKLVATALYSGDLPHELENMHLMHSYEEPLEGLPRVAVEHDTIKLDALFNREHTGTLLRLIFSETEQKSLCRNWIKIKESLVHVLLSNKGQNSSLCFFSDLSCCYSLSKQSDAADSPQSIVRSTEVLLQDSNTRLKHDSKLTMQMYESEKSMFEKSSTASISDQAKVGALLETEATPLLTDHERTQIGDEPVMEEGSACDEKEIERESDEGVIDHLIGETTTLSQQSCKAVGCSISKSEQVTVVAEAGHIPCGSVQRNDISFTELEKAFLSLKLEVKNMSDEDESLIVPETNEYASEKYEHMSLEISKQDETSKFNHAHATESDSERVVSDCSSRVKSEYDSFLCKSQLHSNDLNLISILMDAEDCVQDAMEVNSGLSDMRAMPVGPEDLLSTVRAARNVLRSSDRLIDDVSTDSARLCTIDRNDKRSAVMTRLEHSGAEGYAALAEIEGQAKQISRTSTPSLDDSCRAIGNLFQADTASWEESKNSEILTLDVDDCASFVRGVHANARKSATIESGNAFSTVSENTETSAVRDVNTPKTYVDILIDEVVPKILSERISSEKRDGLLEEKNVIYTQIDQNKSQDDIKTSIDITANDQSAGCGFAYIESSGENIQLRATRMTGQDVVILAAEESAEVVSSGCERDTTKVSDRVAHELEKGGQTKMEEAPGFCDMGSSIVIRRPSVIVESVFDGSPTIVVEDFAWWKELQPSWNNDDVGSLGSPERSRVIDKDFTSETSTLGPLFADVDESVSSEFLTASSEALASASDETFESCDSTFESHPKPLLLKEYKLSKAVDPCEKQSRVDQKTDNSDSSKTNEKYKCFSNIWISCKARLKSGSSGTSSEDDETNYSSEPRMAHVVLNEGLYDSETPDDVAYRRWETPVEDRSLEELNEQNIQTIYGGLRDEDLEMGLQFSDVNKESLIKADSKIKSPASVNKDVHTGSCADVCHEVCSENTLTKWPEYLHSSTTTKSSESPYSEDEKNASYKDEGCSEGLNETKKESVYAVSPSPNEEMSFLVDDITYYVDHTCSWKASRHLNHFVHTSHVSDITRFLAQTMTTVQLAVNQVRYSLGPLEQSREETTTSLTAEECSFSAGNARYVRKERAGVNMKLGSTNPAADVEYEKHQKVGKEEAMKACDQRCMTTNDVMDAKTVKNKATVSQTQLLTYSDTHQELNDQELHEKIYQENPLEAPNKCQQNENREVKRSADKNSSEIVNKKSSENETAENVTIENQEVYHNVEIDQHNCTRNDDGIFHDHKPSEEGEQISLSFVAKEKTTMEMNVEYQCCSIEEDNQLVTSSQSESNRCEIIDTPFLTVSDGSVLSKSAQYEDQKRNAVFEKILPEAKHLLPLQLANGSEELTPESVSADGYPDYTTPLDIMANSEETLGLDRLFGTEDVRPVSEIFQEDMVKREPVNAEENAMGELHERKERLTTCQRSSEKCLNEAEIYERYLHEQEESVTSLPVENVTSEEPKSFEDSFPVTSILECIQEESDSDLLSQEFEETTGNVTSEKNVVPLSILPACPTNTCDKSLCSAMYEETENCKKSIILGMEDPVSSYEHLRVAGGDNRSEVSVPESEEMETPHNIIDHQIDEDSVSDVMEIPNNHAKFTENNPGPTNRTSEENAFAVEEFEGSKLPKIYDDLESDKRCAVQEFESTEVNTNFIDSLNQISSYVQSVINKKKKKTKRRKKKSKTIESASPSHSEPTTDIEARSSQIVSHVESLGTETIEAILRKCSPIKTYHLFAEENDIEFETFMLSSSARAKAFKIKERQDQFSASKTVPSALRSSWGAARRCHVRTIRLGKDPGHLTVEPISLVNGNANWLLFKASEETILLPLITVFSSSHPPARPMVMYTVSLENTIFIAGSSVARLAILAFDDALPTQVLNDHILTRHILYGKLNQTQFDTLIGPNPAGLNLKCQNGMRVAGVLFIYEIGREGPEAEEKFYSVKFRTEPKGLWFYAKLSQCLSLRLLENNTFLHCELQYLPSNINADCLACVRFDDSPLSLFPGYEVTEVIIGQRVDLVRHATTWRRRCTPQLLEWIKQAKKGESEGDSELVSSNRSEGRKRMGKRKRANLQAVNDSETKDDSTAIRVEYRNQDVDHHLLENPRKVLDLNFTGFMAKNNDLFLKKNVHELKNCEEELRNDDEEDKSEGEEDAEEDGDEKEQNEKSDEEDGNNGNDQNNAEDDVSGEEHHDERNTENRDNGDRHKKSDGGDGSSEKVEKKNDEQKDNNDKPKDESGMGVNKSGIGVNVEDNYIHASSRMGSPSLLHRTSKVNVARRQRNEQKIKVKLHVEQVCYDALTSCAADGDTSVGNAKNIENIDEAIENIQQRTAEINTDLPPRDTYTSPGIAHSPVKNYNLSNENLEVAFQNVTSVTINELLLSTAPCNDKRPQFSELSIEPSGVEPTRATTLNNGKIFPNLELRHYSCFKKDIQTSHLILGACGHSILLPRDLFLTTRCVGIGDVTSIGSMLEDFVLPCDNKHLNISSTGPPKLNIENVTSHQTKYDQSPTMCDDKCNSQHDDASRDISFSSRTSDRRSHLKKRLSAWCVPLFQQTVVGDHSIDMLAVVGHVGRAPAGVVQIREQMKLCDGNLVREAAQKVCNTFRDRLREPQIERQLKCSAEKGSFFLLNDQQAGNGSRRPLIKDCDHNPPNKSSCSVLNDQPNALDYKREWKCISGVQFPGMMDNRILVKPPCTAAAVEGRIKFEPLSPIERLWVLNSISVRPKLEEITNGVRNNEEHKSNVVNVPSSNTAHPSPKKFTYAEITKNSIPKASRKKVIGLNEHSGSSLNDGSEGRRLRDATRSQKFIGDPYEIASQCIRTSRSRFENRNELRKDKQGLDESLLCDTEAAGVDSKKRQSIKSYKITKKLSPQRSMKVKPKPLSGQGGVCYRQLSDGSDGPVALGREAEVPSQKDERLWSAVVAANAMGGTHPHGEHGSIGPMRGDVMSVRKDEGVLRNLRGELRKFSSEHSFLYGVQLHGFDLRLIFRVGIQLTYTEEDTEQQGSSPKPTTAWGLDSPKTVWVREGESLMKEDLVPAVRDWCDLNLVTRSGRRRLAAC